MEICTYATLLNRKILVPSSEANFTGVEKHFLTDCMFPLLQKIKIDEMWYLREYPDVQEAIKRGIVRDPKSHYCRFGFYEHRMPYRIVVDEPWYLIEYPDVRAAIANQLFASGQAHFELDGFREGRIPYPNFRLETTDGSGPNGQSRPAAVRSISRSLPGAPRLIEPLQ